MNIGFIGAGKVGVTLGKFFATGGIHVTGYYSLSIESTQVAAEFTGSKAFSSIESLVEASDALFFTVPDSSITEVWLASRGLTSWKNKRILHCSGALASQDAFPGIEETGAQCGSIHPLFPVSDKFQAYKELTDAFFCIEGSDSVVAEFQDLLQKLGCQVRPIAAEAKVRYHAACVMASNLMCGLLQESIDLLGTCGFSQEAARDALAPLVRSNLEHVLAVGPAEALTGPVERNDVSTIQKHLENFPNPHTEAVYRTLSKSLLPLAKARHPEADYDCLEETLG